MWTEFTISTVQKQADGEFNKRERALSSERCAWGQSVSTVSVRVSVCGEWWSGLDRYANQCSKGRRCVSHLIRCVSRCLWCACSSGTCAVHPAPTGSSTAHTPAGRSYAQSTSTRLRVLVGSCTYTAVQHSRSVGVGCERQQVRYELQVTRIDTQAEKRGDCDPRARAGLVGHLRRHRLRTVRTANVRRLEDESQHRLRAPQRPPRSHKQSASPPSLVHLLRTEVRSATHAVKSTRAQREVDESSRALNTKHRARTWRAPRLYIGCVHARPEQLVTRDPNKWRELRCRMRCKFVRRGISTACWYQQQDNNYWTA